MIEYRKMETGDIKEGLRLCREAKWNQLERDWQIFLQLSPDACMVAALRDKIVGTVTTVSYQRSFSWIGMVLVDQAYQRQGIGMKLLEEALQILKDKETIKLDATPAGRAVYLKLNFGDEYSLTRMNRVADKNKLNSSTGSIVRENDLPALMAFDNKIFGADRSLLLQWMWEGAPQLAFMEQENNEVRGYCLGRLGYNFIHIGPVVAKNIDVAKSLVTTALHNCAGSRVILDAAHFEPGWMAWLKQIGFEEQRPLIRMYRGANRFAGIPEKQFAILGPEFG